MSTEHGWESVLQILRKLLQCFTFGSANASTLLPAPCIPASWHPLRLLRPWVDDVKLSWPQIHPSLLKFLSTVQVVPATERNRFLQCLRHGSQGRCPRTKPKISRSVSLMLRLPKEALKQMGRRAPTIPHQTLPTLLVVSQWFSCDG